jgi:hypothetical protein
MGALGGIERSSLVEMIKYHESISSRKAKGSLEPQASEGATVSREGWRGAELHVNYELVI